MVRQGAHTPSQPPRPSERPLQAACCATPRAGRASGQRRLPPNPHPNPHPNPQSRWPPQPPPTPRSELRPRSRERAPSSRHRGFSGSRSPRWRPGAVSRPGSVLLFSDGVFPHFELRLRARVAGRHREVPRPAKVKMTPRYGCISFWVLSVLPLLLSLLCFSYVRAHPRVLSQTGEIPIFTYLYSCFYL